MSFLKQSSIFSSLFDADVDPGLDTSASMASLVTLTPDVVMNQRSSMGATPATIMGIFRLNFSLIFGT